MKYNKIPNTDIDVSVFALGTWVYGGDVWGNTSDDESVDTVNTIIELGVNLIDTAPIYGYGKAEEIVGKAIKDKRDKVVLATKCGLIQKGSKIVGDLSATSIKSEINDSLKRLNTDYIDIYQCHWPDPNTSFKETMDTLLELKSEGKIKHIGLSNYGVDLLKEIIKDVDIVTLQSQYSLLERNLENEVLPFCIENNIGVIPYGALGGGILSGKYKTAPEFKGADARNFFYKYYEGNSFQQTNQLVQLMEEYRKPVNQIALNWLRQQPGVLSVLVGCRTSAQAIENVKSVDWDLSDEELKLISNISQQYGECRLN